MAKIPAEGELSSPIPNMLRWEIEAGRTYRRAESTRGEYGYYMVSDGGRYPRRVYVRGPSYTHAFPVLERISVGANLSDIAGLMASLHIYPPEIER
jgi:NADH-quinone oxidoreductase subunit D